MAVAIEITPADTRTGFAEYARQQRLALEVVECGFDVSMRKCITHVLEDRQWRQDFRLRLRRLGFLFVNFVDVIRQRVLDHALTTIAPGYFDHQSVSER